MPQYDRTLYAGYWLKAYQQGTTTPLNMATDVTGGTTLVKSVLDAQGFPLTAGSARFIPFISGDYDLWLFPTEAEADANDTSSAIQLADNLNADPDFTGQFSPWDTNISYDIPDIVLGSDGNYYYSLVDANQGNDPISSPSEWSVYDFIGKQTLFIPAIAMSPTVSNGCDYVTTVETTAGRPDMVVLDFDATADEHAQFQLAFPKVWNLGTVTFQAFWTSTATDTDGVAWGLQGVAVSDNETIDVAYGAAVVVTDNNISAAEELLVSDESAAVTIAGTPADDDMCFFRVFRDVSDANDTMTEDARLIGIKLHFTTDRGNDI